MSVQSRTRYLLTTLREHVFETPHMLCLPIRSAN